MWDVGGLCGQSFLNEAFCRLERYSRRDGQSRGLKEEATVMVQFLGMWFVLIFCGHLYGGCSVSVQNESDDEYDGEKMAPECRVADKKHEANWSETSCFYV